MGLLNGVRSLFSATGTPQPLQARAVDGFPQQIVGESKYLDSFVHLFGARRADGVDLEVMASLEHEDGNPYDSLAVVVNIEERTVGYLSRIDARVYRAALASVGCANRPLCCRAHVRGGWDDGCGHEGEFGVTLAVDISSPI